MKIFISQPMKGQTIEEISSVRNDYIERLKKRFNCTIIDSLVKHDPVDTNNVAVWNLGYSLQKLSESDLAVFLPGWRDAKGCVIEFEVSVKYGIKTLDLDHWRL